MVNLPPSTLSLLVASLAVPFAVGVTTARAATLVSACPASCANAVVGPSGAVPPDLFAVEISSGATNVQLVELDIDASDTTMPPKTKEGAAVPFTMTGTTLKPDAPLMPNCAAANLMMDGGPTCLGYRIKYTVNNCADPTSPDQHVDFETNDTTGATFPTSAGTLTVSGDPVAVTSGQPGRVQQWDTSQRVTWTAPTGFDQVTNLERITITATDSQMNEMPLNADELASTASVMLVAACDLQVTAAVKDSCGQVLEVVPGTYTLKYAVHGLGNASDPAPATASVTLTCPPPTKSSSGCSIAPGRAGAVGGAAALLIGLAAIAARRRRNR
jgi:MYXO-CTERM domain-containing protein